MKSASVPMLQAGGMDRYDPMSKCIIDGPVRLSQLIFTMTDTLTLATRSLLFSGHRGLPVLPVQPSFLTQTSQEEKMRRQQAACFTEQALHLKF